MLLTPPSSRIFNALLSGNVPELLSSDPNALRPFLPSLARIIRVPPVPLLPAAAAAIGGGVAPDRRIQGAAEERRKVIQTLIIGIGEVNAVMSYLDLNFQVCTWC